MNLGIIVDSSCGLTKDEVEKRGWIFIPLIANINGQDFADGIDLKAKKYFSEMKIDDEVRTSATPPGIIEKAFKEASGKYDHTIVYALSSELSSQTHNLMVAAEDFKNIHVINSKGVGYAIVKDIEESINEDSIEKVITKLQNKTESQYALFLPKSLKWLVKGGRVSPAVAKMANLLKIVPIISLEKGKLDKYGKGRSFAKTAIKCAKHMAHTYPGGEFYIYRGAFFEEEDKIIKEVKKILGNAEIVWLPPIVGNHTGPELFSILVRK